mmetsp:Transcript_27942/g.56017  ORF Transcript_27942/g.56017 Transcript_27942/m.56017 type:complete len:656 (+) Transcript_27942:138-2105(+)
MRGSSGAFVAFLSVVESCTNLLVTPGATDTGTDAYIAYNADSGNLMGNLYHYPVPSLDDQPDTEDVYEWDTGRRLGSVNSSFPTPPVYNVVGNANSAGLVIGETTFGGHPSLLFGQNDSRMDYGSLIYWALRRASTCREAIAVMTATMDEFGYVSEGESFSLADSSTGEVWLMEVMPRGTHGRGATWVAVRIPDGYISAHANHARITTFPREDDPASCRYAPWSDQPIAADHCVYTKGIRWLYADDVVDLARKAKLWNGTAEEEADFSFSDVYDPSVFSNVRFGDARVYAMFSRIVDGEDAGPDGGFAKQHEKYALALDLDADTKRMPLYIVPRRTISAADVRSLMRDRYEKTALNFNGDVGAGPGRAPFRPRPLTWADDEGTGTYFNERAVGTQQTGWNFVAQVRIGVPAAMAAVLWFGADDSSTSPRAPVYASATRLSPAYYGKGSQQGVPSAVLDFDLTKAFWVQNMVSNLAYNGRWNVMYPMIVDEGEALYYQLKTELDKKDKELMSVLSDTAETKGIRGGVVDSKIEEAVKLMSDFSVDSGNKVHSHWMAFYGRLFAQFRDGYSIVPSEGEKSCGCQTNEIGFSGEWKKRIVEETGARYRVPEGTDSGGGDHSDVGDAPTMVPAVKIHAEGKGTRLDKSSLAIFDQLRNY